MQRGSALEKVTSLRSVSRKLQRRWESQAPAPKYWKGLCILTGPLEVTSESGQDWPRPAATLPLQRPGEWRTRFVSGFSSSLFSL